MSGDPAAPTVGRLIGSMRRLLPDASCLCSRYDSVAAAITGKQAAFIDPANMKGIASLDNCSTGASHRRCRRQLDHCASPKRGSTRTDGTERTTDLQARALEVQGVGMSVPMAPVASNGLVYVGNAGGDIPTLTGHAYALDAGDGHIVWRFDTVPDSGPAHDSWKNAAGFPITGGAFWTSFTLDAPNGILYVPAGNPAPDYELSVRPGQNLYTNSVIALDAKTGALLGYRQLVPHDTHDWDVDAPPTLVTTRAGRAIVASANKDGRLSVLDRSGVAAGHGADGAGGAVKVLPLLYQKPTTTRTNMDVPLSRDRPTRFCPGIQGGNEWNGAAYSPSRNTIFTGAVDMCRVAQLQKVPTVGPPGQFWFGAVDSLTESANNKEPSSGWLTAFDAENGAVRWKYHAPKPILAAVTPTAGGLVFSANLGGDVFALDDATGRVLWQTSTAQSTGGGVVTYSSGGHQRLGVAAGMKSPLWPGSAESSRIIVYGLP
jgi:alcohol dehydrogenase (cytochrome c)